jgi:hypothetical protein
LVEWKLHEARAAAAPLHAQIVDPRVLRAAASVLRALTRLHAQSRVALQGLDEAAAQADASATHTRIAERMRDLALEQGGIYVKVRLSRVCVCSCSPERADACTRGVALPRAGSTSARSPSSRTSACQAPVTRAHRSMR